MSAHDEGGDEEETNMSELRYPNESREYRQARQALLLELAKQRGMRDHVRLMAAGQSERFVPPRASSEPAIVVG